MGYSVRVQQVNRPTSRSYYVNLPIALAEAIGVKKAERFEWQLEDRNTIIFSRVTSRKSLRPSSLP